jgi:alkanesulfonate monooxygenase SsuD/methylene tetrahydromethanopterin reductase-like flavin-dependent oxidoreductase (luciferase family)
VVPLVRILFPPALSQANFRIAPVARKLFEFYRRGRGPVMVGSPEEIADELIDWVEATGVDGFNLAYAVTPETFADFVDLVVPELQRRGRYKLDYAPGTLREKLYGPGGGAA